MSGVGVVRDAMVPDPTVLEAAATAREAAALLLLPDVRAVPVVDGRRLVGIVTARILLERVVAAGRDPSSTSVGELADPVELTLSPDLPLEDAYRLLEERDVERVPVTEGGALVGTLSRSALAKRLAEDVPPPERADETA